MLLIVVNRMSRPDIPLHSWRVYLCVLQVSDSMSAIWAALLDDPRAELDKHFDAIARYEIGRDKCVH